jgi:hypothetical protein
MGVEEASGMGIEKVNSEVQKICENLAVATEGFRNIVNQNFLTEANKKAKL